MFKSHRITEGSKNRKKGDIDLLKIAELLKWHVFVHLALIGLLIFLCHEIEILVHIFDIFTMFETSIFFGTKNFQRRSVKFFILQ